MGEWNITAMFLSDWRFSLRILAEEVANLIEPNLLQPSVASWETPKKQRELPGPGGFQANIFEKIIWIGTLMEHRTLNQRE